MESQKIAISLLFLAVLVAGCSDSSSDAAIEVRQLSVEPQQIYEGTSVSVSLDLVNTGNLPARIDLGEKGERVMKNYCPDTFEISDFTVTTSGKHDQDENVVELQPDRDLNMRWRLDHIGNTPLYGERCDLEFVTVFNYSVKALNQVEIKNNENVEGSPELDTQSSQGPLFFAIETVGSSTGDQSRFVKSLDDEVTTHLQLRNHGQEGVAKGIVNVQEESLEISATPPLDFEENYDIWSSEEDTICDISEDEDLRISERGSRILTCNIPLEDVEFEDPAQLSEIFASVNYTYRKDLGSRRVEVEVRE